MTFPNVQTFCSRHVFFVLFVCSFLLLFCSSHFFVFPDLHLPDLSLHGTARNFALFPSPAPCSLFSSSLEGLLAELEPRIALWTTQIVRFGFSGVILCELPAAYKPPECHKMTHFTKWGGRGKKSAKFWAPTLWAPTFRAPLEDRLSSIQSID